MQQALPLAPRKSHHRKPLIGARGTGIRRIPPKHLSPTTYGSAPHHGASRLAVTGLPGAAAPRAAAAPGRRPGVRPGPTGGSSPRRRRSPLLQFHETDEPISEQHRPDLDLGRRERRKVGPGGREVAPGEGGAGLTARVGVAGLDPMALLDHAIAASCPRLLRRRAPAPAASACCPAHAGPPPRRPWSVPWAAAWRSSAPPSRRARRGLDTRATSAATPFGGEGPGSRPARPDRASTSHRARTAARPRGIGRGSHRYRWRGPTPIVRARGTRGPRPPAAGSRAGRTRQSADCRWRREAVSPHRPPPRRATRS